MTERGWLIIGRLGAYQGWWHTQRDAIRHHCTTRGRTWIECRRVGDRAVRCTVSWDDAVGRGGGGDG